MPEFIPEQIQVLDLVKQSRPKVISSVPEPVIQSRVMTVTAYTKNDPGMDGRGITNNEEMVQEGRTIAADPTIPFGSHIHIPALNHTYVVVDRGSAIEGNRLDLYMENRSDAIEFGVQELEVFIKY